MSFGRFLHFGGVRHTGPSVVLSWTMLLQLLGSPGAASGQHSIPSKANQSIRFRTLTTRDICQQKAARKKLYILKLETSPQTQQIEQFKTEVCGCKKQCPRTYHHIFHSTSSLLCIPLMEHPQLLQADTQCLTSPPCASRHRTSLLLVTMSVKGYRHQQSQWHFRKRGWGVEKSLRKGQPRHTDTLYIDLKWLTHGFCRNYWKFISVFHTVPKISSGRTNILSPCNLTWKIGSTFLKE